MITKSVTDSIWELYSCPIFRNDGKITPLRFVQRFCKAVDDLNVPDHVKNLLFVLFVKDDDSYWCSDLLIHKNTFSDWVNQFLDYYWNEATQDGILKDFKNFRFDYKHYWEFSRQLEIWYLRLSGLDRKYPDWFIFKELIEKLPRKLRPSLSIIDFSDYNDFRSKVLRVMRFERERKPLTDRELESERLRNDQEQDERAAICNTICSLLDPFVKLEQAQYYPTSTTLYSNITSTIESPLVQAPLISVPPPISTTPFPSTEITFSDGFSQPVALINSSPTTVIEPISSNDVDFPLFVPMANDECSPDQRLSNGSCEFIDVANSRENEYPLSSLPRSRRNMKKKLRRRMLYEPDYNLILKSPNDPDEIVNCSLQKDNVRCDSSISCFPLALNDEDIRVKIPILGTRVSKVRKLTKPYRSNGLKLIERPKYLVFFGTSRFANNALYLTSKPILETKEINVASTDTTCDCDSACLMPTEPNFEPEARNPSELSQIEPMLVSKYEDAGGINVDPQIEVDVTSLPNSNDRFESDPTRHIFDSDTIASNSPDLQTDLIPSFSQFVEERAQASLFESLPSVTAHADLPPCLSNDATDSNNDIELDSVGVRDACELTELKLPDEILKSRTYRATDYRKVDQTTDVTSYPFYIAAECFRKLVEVLYFITLFCFSIFVPLPLQESVPNENAGGKYSSEDIFRNFDNRLSMLVFLSPEKLNSQRKIYDGGGLPHTTFGGNNPATIIQKTEPCNDNFLQSRKPFNELKRAMFCFAIRAYHSTLSYYCHPPIS